MELNDYGKIAEQQWHWLGAQCPYVVLHEFVVMPNHVHGIIEINRGMIPPAFVGTGRDDVGTGRDLSLQYGPSGERNPSEQYDPSEQPDPSEFMGTGHDPSLQEQPIKIKSLSQLMGAYKTTSSKKIHLSEYETFRWQRSFHDHIIRDEKSFETISNYIINNPAT